MKTGERIRFNLAASILFSGFGFLFTGSWAGAPAMLVGWWIGLVLYVGLFKK